MKRLAYIDRGAVLFLGIAVGALLLMSFQAGGHPIASLMAAETPKLTAPTVALPVAKACKDDFPFSRRVLAGVRANRPLRIGVLGDSFGDGIWAATTQALQANHDFKVIQLSKEGTGFTRYQSVNLLEDMKARLAEQPIDIALIDFGANDTQGVRADGVGAAYMSDRWQAIIGGRVQSLIDHLHDKGVAVAWIGLPRMRKADYDNQVQAMNVFYAGLMCKLHVPFINPVAVTQDRDHHFAKDLIDPVTHASYAARADDGVHMSVHGYRVIARPLLERIDLLSPQDGE